jgi:hypothetical protein
MTTTLNVGDKVRVKKLAALGTIISVSSRLRHTPYLVDIPGYGARGYALADLELLPGGVAPTMPPPGMPLP